MHDYHTRIRQLMTVRNVTQAGMMRNTGIPRTTMTRLLNGETDFSINQLEQVATALNLSSNDVVSPLPFDHYALTGIAKLDDLVRRVTALRSMPYDCQAHEIYCTTHVPDALCYSPTYARWNHDDRPCPKKIDVQRKSDLPVESCTPAQRIEVALHEHTKIDGLYGILVSDELHLNDLSFRNKGEKERHIYIPLRATVTGSNRVSVTTQMFANPSHRVNGSTSQDEYILTASVKSIKNGSSDAIIRHKLWLPIPDISNFVSERSAFEKYVEMVVN